MMTNKVKTLRLAAILLISGFVMLSIDGIFFKGIGAGSLLLGAITLLKGLFQTITSSPNENVALQKTEDLPFRHFFGDSGIALDPEKKEIHLYSKPNYKTYKFEDVRRWETNIQTGGQIYGTGLAVASANIAAARSNVKNSGLFLDVRDIDFPRWRIEFNLRKIEKEIPRWMEILRQHINES